MVNAKRIVVFIVLSFLLVLLQTPAVFAQESSSSSDEGAVTSDVTYTESTDAEATPPPEEVTTEKTNSSTKKSKDETEKVAVPESAVMAMTTGGTSSSVAGGVFSNPQAVSVSQVGAASFSYPIAVPPGRNGLQPNVSLQYSSYNENGWVGVGWDLDLGSIKRSTKNGLSYSGTDFVANGSELVANSSWGANYYCEKIEGAFTQYYYNSSSNYWLVTVKDGTKYYYGQTTASRIASGNNTYSWHLNRVEDTNGNYMEITYTTNSGQLYPYQIAYTGNSGLSPNKTVEFELEDRGPFDIINSYKTKSLVTTSKRLKTITVKAGTTTVYKYSLGYEYAPNNGRSRLISISQVDPDNPNNTLPITEFLWTDGGDGSFGTPNTMSLAGNTTGSKIAFGDINGDGREDFIKYCFSDFPVVVAYPYYANGSGSFTQLGSVTLGLSPDANSMSAALGDINGDGKADIVFNHLDGSVYAYLYNGNGTFSSLYSSSSQYGISSIYLADLNGDGLADLVKYNSSQEIVWSHLSNGDGTFQTGPYYSKALNTIGGTIHLGDVNGDGITDLCISDALFMPLYSLTVAVYLGNGSGAFNTCYWSEIMGSSGMPIKGTLADVNGDGLADYLVNFLNSTMSVYLSTGTGMTGPYTTSMNGAPSFADIDDDGMADMITCNTSTGAKSFFKSKGDGTFFTPIPEGGTTGTNLLLADIDGDGRPDMIEYNASSISYAFADGEDAGDKIETVINPLGGETSITYGNNTNISNNMVPFTLHPVMDIQTDDGNNLFLTTYDYSNAYYKYADRDFRGFGTVIQTNPDATTVTTTYEQLDDYKKGRPLQVDMKNAGGALLKRATFTWAADAISGTTAKFVKLTNKRTDIYGATNVYTNEAYTYNSTHGGVVTTVSTGSSGAESVTLTNSYINKGAWLWRKDSESITGSYPGTRVTTYTYNSYGNLLTKTYLNGSGAWPVETYTYDSYGNVATSIDPKNNTTSYTYDTTFTYVTGITYPSTGIAHSVSRQYNIFGKLDQETDENSQTTYYGYDNFGRLYQVDYPDEGQTIYEYNDTANPVYVKTRVKESTSSYVESWQYVDGFGRAIMSVSKGVGSNYVVTKQFYDNMGRNYYSAGPYFADNYTFTHNKISSTFPTTSRTYDYMGRVIGVFTPLYNGTLDQFNTTAITYNGFITTITDAKGNIRVEETDYLGRIIRVQEDTGGGTTYYTYNAVGDLTSVTDAAGNVTTINYNTLGQKINMQDPDMGTWYYSYDLNGNLYQQTDALGQTITFTYDALNRVTFKDYSTSDPDITYSYDFPIPGANGKGRLYSVTNGNDTTTYNNYDEMGRPLNVTKSIAGDQARTTSYIYDYSGKTIRTTYPDNFYVDNAYHAGSNLLNTVRGSDGVYYATIGSYSPSGKIISLSHGNNTSTTYTYDARSEKLSQIATISNVSGTIQQKSYDYTAIGEISSITDQHNSKTYAYTYDKIGRFTNETTNGTSSMTMAYNAIGNITSKIVGGNTFTYSYSTSHKHAVSGVTYNGTTYSYTYDANGNMTYGADFTNLGSIQARTITYNADNMPTQISHSSNITTQLTYGGTGERVKKRVYSGGNVTDTYYIGDHFEVKGGETIKYIFAGNLRVAQVKGANTPSFFHKDHLGSSTVMTDASGYELESTEYAPFGSQRSHTGTNTSDYRYTDQELDAENGLYNYNARLYDPFIGRFISPDTIVQAPYNPQSLNRYSYCLNNPLIYVDPSGHFWEWGEEFWNSLKGLLGQTWQDITDAFSKIGGWFGFGKTATVTVGPLMDDYGNTYGGGSSGGGSGNLDNSREASHDRFCMEHLKNPDTPYNEPRNIDTINKLINEFGIDKKGANIQYKEKWYAFGSVDFNDGLVTISSSAFRSRSFLISTIDHEVVTHYGEQYYKGYICPSNNEQCSWMQEYQAVKRQLEKAVDYGSTPDEIKFYECRKNRYYNGLTDENKLRVNKGEYYPEYKWRKK